MASIPLFCNICPKEPEFSDISHLLTHVASKGHLSQQFKAQVRARQDTSVREKLDAYDRWYELHQIEKLLSQRMIAKDSKDTGRLPGNKGTSLTSTTSKSAKGTKPRKRRGKTSEKPEQHSSPVKLEGTIDPQLYHSERTGSPYSRPFPTYIDQLRSEDDGSHPDFSHPSADTPLRNSQLPFLTLPYHDHGHRTHVPRMSAWQGGSSPQRTNTEAPPTNNENGLPTHAHDTDGESDYFRTFLRSPTRTAYPDPLEVTTHGSGFMVGSPHSVMRQDEMEHINNEAASTYDSPKLEDAITQSPILKGVKWPGMSLFDSASLEAQRLRNQKKDTSVVEQMEHNSAMVEQLERIYWPDGSFKKQRLITGNVESSPIKEPTPPPKQRKRRRTKVDKQILSDVSTNATVFAKKPGACKGTSRIPTTQASDLRNISNEALANIGPPEFAYPRSAHMSYDPTDEEEIERHLTRGVPKNGRGRAFDIYNDQKPSPDDEQLESHSRENHTSFLHSVHGHHGTSQSCASSISIRRTPLSSLQSVIEDPSHEIPKSSQIRSWARTSRAPNMDEDSENIEPILDCEGRIDDEAAPTVTERLTQRYFSVAGNQPPQFFSSMPPGMDFGGSMEPRYRGTALNPLNPYLRQEHFLPRHDQASFPFPGVRRPLEPAANRTSSDQLGPSDKGRHDRRKLSRL